MGSWLLLILLGMIWGGSFLGVEMALRDFGPITIAMVRVLLAAIILTIVAQLTGHHLPSISTAVGRRTWLHCFGMGLFSNALPFSLLAWGQQSVTTSFAGICMAVVPLLVLPLSHFLIPDERMTRSKIFGFLLGFVGVVLLVAGDSLLEGLFTNLQSGDGVDSAPIQGILWAQIACVIASCCYAVGTIVTKLCPPISTLAFSATGLLLGSTMLIPTALIIEGVPSLPSLAGSIGVLYLGLMATATATILLVLLIKNAGPPFLTLVNYQVPVWAVLIGAIVLSESLPGHFLLALLFILVGLAISQFYDRWKTARS